MPKRSTERPERASLKLLLWTAVVGVICGLIGFGEIAEDWLRASRNSFHHQDASGDIVLVMIDDEALSDVGRWPWPRRHHAEMIEKLSAAGANRIFLDLILENASAPEEDARLANALDGPTEVILAARRRSGTDGDVVRTHFIEEISRHADFASISVNYNYQNAVWRLPYQETTDPLPIFSVKLANAKPGTGSFMIDYSIDPGTIPQIGASDLLAGTADLSLIRGRDVVIASSSDAIGDRYFLPGWGRMSGVFIHLLGAETLKSGTPIYLGWLPAFLLALVSAGLALFRLRGRTQILCIAAAALAILVTPIFTEARLIFLDVTPGLLVVMVVGSALAWRHFRSSGFVNGVSGLPNLAAIHSNRGARDKALIVAKILNYSEITAALPPGEERKLVEQIVARLTVGVPDRLLYHGDGGIFAWFEDSRSPFGNHIEALYALFRTPARAGGLAVDLTISFGVEIGSSRSLSNRLASALVAADEAAHDGLKWKFYDPEALQDATWKLSMLSQLDSAVDKGEVWVAYQPKLDIKTRRIVGAEALARWTHPEKGPIAASEFISAAEQHDRIGKLTDFVLEQAIKAAASVNQRQPGFGIAVNLSAKLLADQGFTLRLAAMLARHQLPPDRLTLELTETAELAGSGHAIDMLGAICELGVNISIDDYGTGLSTLDYLKKIPATELKIDQSFVKSMLDNRSDMVMVQSTIALAHSLGRKVVAEGVEQQAILDLLVEMNCDVAQGYIVGRPMSLDGLMRRLPRADHSFRVA